LLSSVHSLAAIFSHLYFCGVNFTYIINIIWTLSKEKRARRGLLDNDLSG